uniref:Uncharacterized protein n=1 Tax=Anopheles atroparvus TaxID=41427 RepID=A0AAG5DA53_ANOAO
MVVLEGVVMCLMQEMESWKPMFHSNLELLNCEVTQSSSMKEMGPSEYMLHSKPGPSSSEQDR